jgi:hypothetical protein
MRSSKSRWKRYFFTTTIAPIVGLHHTERKKHGKVVTDDQFRDENIHFSNTRFHFSGSIKKSISNTFFMLFSCSHISSYTVFVVPSLKTFPLRSLCDQSHFNRIFDAFLPTSMENVVSSSNRHH